MIERGSIETSAGEISFLDTKKGDRTLVYIHGGFGGPNAIEVFERRLSKDGWRIVSPSLPGHGRSFGLNKSLGYKDIVGSMSEFLRQFPEATVIGHSFGGRIAWDITKEPDIKIDKLVLLAPLFAKIENGFLKVAGGIAKDYSLDSRLETVKNDRTEAWRNLFRWRDLKRVWYIIKNLETVELLEILRPTLIMWGQRDSAIILQNNREVLDKMSGIKLKVYPGAHFLYFKSGEHWEALKSFINQ